MSRQETKIALLAVLALAAAPAEAKPAVKPGGPPPACGLKVLPMAVGNQWTYKQGSQQVTIKVTEVAPGKDYAGKPVTTITTEEFWQGRTFKATHTCTPTGGLSISLDSFLFTGEPGGATGATMNVTSREKASVLADAEMIADQGWVEIVKADVVRVDGDTSNAQHKPAKIEVERHVSVKGDEKVMVGLGQFTSQKILFELRGRALVDDQTAEIPIKRPATMWLAKGVGYVKIDDAFDKTWELVDSNVLPK